MPRVAVLAAGEVAADPSGRLRRALSTIDRVIAVDGGIVHAAALGLDVDVLIGDLDSAPPDLVASVRGGGATVLEFPADKDETDLDLALRHLVDASLGAPTEVLVIGALGGRIDHELANLGLLAARRWHDAGLRVRIEDAHRSMHVVHDEVELREPQGTVISVLPWHGAATGVRERGMRWDLDDATLSAGSSQGMSNVAVESTQRISVVEGVLLVIVDRSL